MSVIMEAVAANIFGSVAISHPRECLPLQLFLHALLFLLLNLFSQQLSTFLFCFLLGLDLPGNGPWCHCAFTSKVFPSFYFCSESVWRYWFVSSLKVPVQVFLFRLGHRTHHTWAGSKLVAQPQLQSHHLQSIGQPNLCGLLQSFVWLCEAPVCVCICCCCVCCVV